MKEEEEEEGGVGKWRVEVVSALYHYSNDNVAETGCLSAGKLGDPLRVFLMAILSVMR